MLREGQQKKIEDCLCDADQGVLRNMHSLSGMHLEKKIGQEDQTEKECDVVQRTTCRTIGICEANAEHSLRLLSGMLRGGRQKPTIVGPLPRQVLHEKPGDAHEKGKQHDEKNLRAQRAEETKIGNRRTVRSVAAHETFSFEIGFALQS